MIYLDYNATTPVRDEVIQAVVNAASGAPKNPSSAHACGRGAKKILEDSRKTIADAVGCFAHEIIFTSSGTEANNLAINGWLDAIAERDSSDSPTIITSEIEHASILKTVPKNAKLIPTLPSGIVDISALQQILEAEKDAGKSNIFVSVMLANNESGVIQPIAEIANIVHEYGGIFHCDAVQAFGKIPLDIGLLSVDMLSLSAHKIGGIHGAAALIIRQNIGKKPPSTDIKAQITGGGQEQGYRSGTENIEAIAGFAKAAELAAGDLKNDAWHSKIEASLRNMEQRIKNELPSAIIAGEGADRLPNTSMIALPGVSAEVQLMNMDLAGFAISAGSACSSGKIAASHVLEAMGMTSASNCAIRISAGYHTTTDEIENFTDEYLKMAKRLVG